MCPQNYPPGFMPIDDPQERPWVCEDCGHKQWVPFDNADYLCDACYEPEDEEDDDD